VFSILLAFGIQAGWEARQAALAESAYLARIRADLVDTREQITRFTEDYALIIRHGEAVMPILAGGEAFPPDTVGFLTSVLQASRTADPVVARGAYDDLISTGNLNVLRDEDLRLAVSLFYAQVESLLSPTDFGPDQAPYRAAVRAIIPLRLQLAIRESCFDAGPLTCPTLPTFEGLSEVVSALLSEPDLVQNLNRSLQAKAIRLGSVLTQGTVPAGFGAVQLRIDEVLSHIDAAS